MLYSLNSIIYDLEGVFHPNEYFEDFYNGLLKMKI